MKRLLGLVLLAACLPFTAAFGQILTQEILDIPARGTVNVHPSLLPKHRGPAPLNWCLIQGDTETGVTLMLTDAGIDEKWYAPIHGRLYTQIFGKDCVSVDELIATTLSHMGY